MFFSSDTPFFQYWVAARPIPGERESGDQYAVASSDSRALVAVIDGLGHGTHAAAAAKLAAETLTSNLDAPVETLVQHCHEALRRTRGAVMSVASFNAANGALTWVGIGNVEGLILPANKMPGAKRANLINRGGIVGDRLPQLRPVTVNVHPGDILLFATDGIGSAFIHDIKHVERPGDLVHLIFQQHAKKTDDALILGVQWKSGDGMPATEGMSISPLKTDASP